jgi:hypothetical protein
MSRSCKPYKKIQISGSLPLLTAMAEKIDLYTDIKTKPVLVKGNHYRLIYQRKSRIKLINWIYEGATIYNLEIKTRLSG